MKTHQRGSVNLLLVCLIVALVGLLGAAVSAVLIYQKEQHYQNDAQNLANTAAASAKQDQSAADAKQYAAEAELPLQTYTGPAAYGSIVVEYPKNWSAYVEEQDGSSTPINAYFQPGFVPSTDDQNNSFAARLEVTQETYDQVMQQFNGYVTQGTAKVAPYSLPKVPSVVGAEVTGQIASQKQGLMVVLPFRDMTLELWTEASQYTSDFNANILPNFSFSP